MIELLSTAIKSPIIIVIIVLYAITSAITTFDIRMTQAKRDGILPPDEPMPPKWVAIVFWIDWAFALALIFLNWRYAILVFVIRFILKVLPVLEIIGNILMAPFKPKNNFTRNIIKIKKLLPLLFLAIAFVIIPVLYS